MTISHAHESFCIDNPSFMISWSKFFELRLKDVKPESPHDVFAPMYRNIVAADEIHSKISMIQLTTKITTFK